MDWQRFVAATGLLWLLLICLPLASAWSVPHAAIVHSNSPSTSSSWSAVAPVAAVQSRQLNEVSPYIDLVLCPIRSEPWTCARQQGARILDVWDGELHNQWQKLKVEADRQLNATIEKRGYSASELPIKEKPSTILKKIEIGTNYMKEYLAETMDGFLGREYEYLQTSKVASSVDDDSENDQSGTNNNVDYEEDGEAQAAAAHEDDNENETDEEDEDGDDASESAEREPEDEEDEAAGDENESVANGVTNQVKHTSTSALSVNEENSSGGAEFIEIEEGQEKKPGGGKRKQKNKKKKKGQQQPATLVVVQQAPEIEHHHDVSDAHETFIPVVSQGQDGGHGHGKPFKRKQKRGKRKKKGQQSAVAVEHESSDHLGLGLLEDLVDVGDSGGGGKRKHKKPTNYGRSNGVTRGKKKKKKKALMKLVLLGSFLKAKIELLLKILGAHLQIKFFAIALIGLLINIARFWIDVKRGGAPHKVVYVEHAHHQHHYEDHGDDWSEQGSYWKRSLQTDPSIEDTDSSTDSYQVRPQQLQKAQDPHYLAYRNQYQWQ